MKIDLSVLGRDIAPALASLASMIPPLGYPPEYAALYEKSGALTPVPMLPQPSGVAYA